MAAAAAGLFLYLFVENLPGKPHQVINAQPQVTFVYDQAMDTVGSVPIRVTITADEVRFPVETLREHRMVEFEYPAENHVVPLLAYVNNEGRLVTSIRICEPCNSKTFTIEGDDLHCGNCETAWSLRTLDGLQGSCQKYPPDPIPSAVRDGSVVIKVSEIVNWKIRI